MINIIKKAVLFILILIAFFGNMSFAQSTRVGIRAGALLTNWDVKGVESTTGSSLVGPEAAITTDFRISPSFSIQAELGYASAGSKLSYGGEENAKYKSSYFVIPVLAKYNLPNGMSLMAGPQIGFLLTAKGELPDGSKLDIKSMLKSQDFFFVAGVEYNFPVGLTIGARVNKGLTNIYESQDVSGAKLQNFSFGLSLGYTFQLPDRKPTK